MRQILILGAALAVSGCQFIPGSDQAKVAAAQKLAAASLKDPGSVQFRATVANGPYVCGEMNGRNSFGAFAGFKKFVTKGDELTLEPSENDGAEAAGYFEVIWSASCDIKY